MSAPAPFSALLLAGGLSTRMGRDKALLPHPVSGLPLLAHQAALLLALPGCVELLLSAPADRGYELTGPLADARLVADAAPDCGPLAGLAAGLAEATSPRLLVLAVDLPFVTRDYLTRLLGSDAAPVAFAGGEDASPPKTSDSFSPLSGRVPRHPDGFFEPLCAVYPIFDDSLAETTAALARRDLSLQRLLTAACATGWMRPLAVSAGDLPLLANWNTPTDL